MEYAKAMEPVQMVSSTSDEVTIINRRDHITLDDLKCEWSLTVDNNKPPEGGDLEMPSGIKPGATGKIKLPALGELAGEAFVTLSFKLRSDTRWAKAGHEVAWLQAPVGNSKELRHSVKAPQDESHSSPFGVNVHGSSLKVRCQGSQWSFDLARGVLSSWEKDGTHMLTRDIEPSFYRAPTDNDAGGGDGRDWKDRFLHLARLQTRNAEWRQEDSEVVVEIDQRFAPPVLSWSIVLRTKYQFGKDGSVRITVKGTPTGLNLPRTLPRIGVTLGLSKDMQRIEWFGRGPGESYKDMKLSQKIGRHAFSSIQDLWAEPEFPQESSNRTDTYWLSLSETKGKKASLTAQFFDPEGPTERRLFDFMACHYDVQDIDQAQHPYELEHKAKEEVILRLDADHHGLGTGSCGPKTFPEYTLLAQPFHFGVLLH